MVGVVEQEHVARPDVAAKVVVHRTRRPGSAPTWIGTCSAWAIRRPSASHSAVEKSRLELMICEYEVRSIASPISSAIACSRWRTTETVMGSTPSCAFAGTTRLPDDERCNIAGRLTVAIGRAPRAQAKRSEHRVGLDLRHVGRARERRAGAGRARPADAREEVVEAIVAARDHHPAHLELRLGAGVDELVPVAGADVDRRAGLERIGTAVDHRLAAPFEEEQELLLGGMDVLADVAAGRDHLDAGRELADRGCRRCETRTSAWPFAGTGCQKLSPHRAGPRPPRYRALRTSLIFLNSARRQIASSAGGRAGSVRVTRTDHVTAHSARKVKTAFVACAYSHVVRSCCQLAGRPSSCSSPGSPGRSR